MLLARLSRLGLSRFIDIGCAPLPLFGSFADKPPPSESRCPIPQPPGFPLAPPILIACAGRTSLPDVDWSAVVRLEEWGCHGFCEPMLIGCVAMLPSFIKSLNKGKVESSMSASSKVESTYEVGLLGGPYGRWCQEKRSSFSFSFSDFRE